MLDEVNREAAREGVAIDESAPIRHVLQAAWERAEMARALIDTDFPLLNAHGVAAHVFALDTLIEDLIPEAQKIITGEVARQLSERVRAENQTSRHRLRQSTALRSLTISYRRSPPHFETTSANLVLLGVSARSDTKTPFARAGSVVDGNYLPTWSGQWLRLIPYGI